MRVDRFSGLGMSSFRTGARGLGFGLRIGVGIRLHDESHGRLSELELSFGMRAEVGVGSRDNG